MNVTFYISLSPIYAALIVHRLGLGRDSRQMAVFLASIATLFFLAFKDLAYPKETRQ